jgi:hypothetical protein
MSRRNERSDLVGVFRSLQLRNRSFGVTSLQASQAFWFRHNAAAVEIALVRKRVCGCWRLWQAERWAVMPRQTDVQYSALV